LDVKFPPKERVIVAGNVNATVPTQKVSSMKQPPIDVGWRKCMLCGYNNHPRDVVGRAGKCGLCHKPLKPPTSATQKGGGEIN